MCKNIILISLFSLISIPSFSQVPKIEKHENGEYYYQQVINIDGKNKSDIYDGALTWIAKNYNSAKDVIQYKDKESGKIIVKGAYTTTNYGWKVYLKHTLTIEVKAHKFRITFDQLEYQSASSSDSYSFSSKIQRKKKMLERLQIKIYESITSLINSLKNNSNDNW